MIGLESFLSTLTRVASLHGVAPHHLLGTKRDRAHTTARDAFWAELYRADGASYRGLASILHFDAKSICDGVDRHLNRQRSAA